MIRYGNASKLGLVEPLVRMQRRAHAAALASAEQRRDSPQRSCAGLRSAVRQEHDPDSSAERKSTTFVASFLVDG
jgi:hypothetical protein